jgi:hypothetical protein
VLQPVPFPTRDGPCDPRPRAPVQSLWGAGLGVSSRSPGLPWVVSTIRPNADPCREGGLSSTDERVRGHVIEERSHTDRLFGSRPNVVPASPTRIVETI